MKKLEEIILGLHEKELIKFGHFVLSSGKHSSFYINLRVLPSYPSLFRNVMELALERITYHFDSVCGIATGGIPFAAYIAFKLNKPLVYVRKKRKEYGSQDLLVGYPQGTVLLVDDVATTGHSLNHAVNVLKSSNISDIKIFVLVIRNRSLINVFETRGINFGYLLDAHAILDTLWRYKRINREIYIRAKEELNSKN